MNDEIAIEAFGLSKRYLLGENTSRDRLREVFQPITPAGGAPPVNELWALRDLSFAIARGGVIGIIGHNGAGKSTLLKILSRVTKPTMGHARINGRVGSLLDVATGFNSELTGRDNIFLSGTILGMSFAEVRRKFDEIVAFSEVERFINTPVKRYSTGMAVRLAFAVAAFLEPDVLFVDEVLSVGDFSFQLKSFACLEDIARKDGRTVLFVGHDLQAIRAHCKRVLVLDRGQLVFDGSAADGIEHYVRMMRNAGSFHDLDTDRRDGRATGAARFRRVTPRNSRDEVTWRFQQGETVKFYFDYEIMQRIPDMALEIKLRSATDGKTIATMRDIVAPPSEPGHKGVIELTLPHLPLCPMELTLSASLGQVDDDVCFDIVDDKTGLPMLVISPGPGDARGNDGIVTLSHQMRLHS